VRENVDETRCPECEDWFKTKKGKIYCSRKCQKKAGGTRHDARRIPRQSEKGTKFRLSHTGYDRERMKNTRAKYGRNDGPFAKLIEDQFNSLHFESESCIVASDWHIPFHHTGYFNWVLDVQAEYGIKDVAIAGDLMDADSYSLWPKDGLRACFEKELELTGMVLSILGDAFENVYICRGNHENRFIKQNNDNLRMEGLMKLANAPENVQVTNDTCMTATIGDDEWMFAHPKQFRQTPLSVARDLAAKYHKNIVSAHGHFFGQGYDRSGRFYCLDGGGIFDPACLVYLRSVNTTPWVSQGFYLIDESGYIPYSLGKER
jgi:hypothetical protein